MKRKPLIIWIALLFLMPDAFSQNGQISTPSPESMNLIRDIQHPVDYSSGIININVPLFNVEHSGLNVPVSLGYHASGIKIEDRTGIVGLGWRLSAGGRVTRIVKQYPDGTKPAKWGLTPQAVCDALYQNRESDVDYNPLDTEPDLFFFEIPGKSGMFVLGHSGNAHTIPYQNISIEWINQNYFRIKDENGTVYTLGESSSSREQTNTVHTNKKKENGNESLVKEESLSYVSTWHLNRIQSHTGQTISFSYIEGEVQQQDNSNYILLCTFGGTDIAEHTINANITTHTKFLKTISWGTGKLEFSKHTQIPTCLGSVSIFSPDGDLLKTTRFSYTKKLYDRVLLDRINDEFSDASSSLVASFEYYSRSLPGYDSKDYDFYGYYNGKNNTTHYPSYSYYSGANRTPDLEYTKAHVLTAVNYPTGGRMEYVYELNQFSGSQLSSTGGLRIAEVRQIEDGRTHATKYQYQGNGGTSGYAVSSIKYAYQSEGDPLYQYLIIHSKPINNLYDPTGRHVAYSCVTEVLPDGSKNRYSYTRNSGLDIYSNKLSYIWKCSYVGGSFYNSFLNGTSGSEAPGVVFPNTSRFWRRNLLEKTERLDANDRLIEGKTYTYDVIQANRAVIKSYLPFVAHRPNGENKYVCEYEWESQPVYLKEVNTIASEYTPASKTTYTYNTEYMVPVTIQHENAEGIVTKTVMKYPFHYSSFAPDIDEFSFSYGVYALKNERMTPVVEKVLLRNNKVISAEIREFKSHRVGQKVMVVPSEDFALKLENPISDFSYSYVDYHDFEKDSRYQRMVMYHKYDNAGRLTMMQNSLTKQKFSTVYDLKGQVIATVEHATHAVPAPAEISGWYFLGEYGGYPLRTERFEVPYDQTVNFSSMKGYENPMPVNRVVTYNIKNTKGGIEYSYESSQLSTDTFSATLAAGTYYLEVDCNQDDRTTSTNIEYELFEYTGTQYDRENQVFYTSFEEVDVAPSPYAKTGRKFRPGNYYLNLQNFAPGYYELTYWESGDSGLTWNKITQDVDAYSTPYVLVGQSNRHIDEVRLIPKGSRISTYTYLPGGRKLTEMDHHGRTIYYEYDSQNRLYRIHDNDRNLLKEYQYKTLY